MSLFFYLFTLAQFVVPQFITADSDVTAVFVNINMVFSDEDKILITRMWDNAQRDGRPVEHR